MKKITSSSLVSNQGNDSLMEERQATITAIATAIFLSIIIVVARVAFKLTKPFYLITGAVATSILTVMAYMFIRRRFNSRRRILEARLVSEGRELRTEYSFLRKVAGVPTKFRLKELELATDNFQSLVGRGASASVFKGILTDGTVVAVKRIEGEENGERQFRSEVAAIANVQHVNLVRLFGYCIVPGGSRFLVYDFIQNGSLDKWIFPKRGDHGTHLPHHRHGNFLTWELRYQIAIDVAKALSYLHHDCRSRILHLDVKPENILIDENYHAVVSDFGLSKQMGKDESRFFSTIRGTRGYLAPEWLLELGVSEKSDTFSFGMVLLEMIGGKRNIHLIDTGLERSQRRCQYFPKMVNEKRKEGKIMEIVDHRLIEHGGIDENELNNLVNIAMWCIQDKARLRPTMTQVVDMLEGKLPIDEPPNCEMVIVDVMSIDDDDAQLPMAVGVDGRNRKKLVATLMTGDQVVSDVPSMSASGAFAISVVLAR